MVERDCEEEGHPITGAVLLANCCYNWDPHESSVGCQNPRSGVGGMLVCGSAGGVLAALLPSPVGQKHNPGLSWTSPKVTPMGCLKRSRMLANLMENGGEACVLPLSMTSKRGSAVCKGSLWYAVTQE